MISLDTNLVVRYLVRGDPQQAEVARALLEGLTPERPGYICREVMVETVWVLESAYEFTRSQIHEVVLGLLTTDSLEVEASSDVAMAASAYRQGGADFSDAMILAAAQRQGALPLYTLDRRLARMDGATLAG